MNILGKNQQIKKRNLVKMNNSAIEKQNQILNFDKLGKLSEYFAKFKIGTLLNQSRIIKTLDCY